MTVSSFFDKFDVVNISSCWKKTGKSTWLVWNSVPLNPLICCFPLHSPFSEQTHILIPVLLIFDTGPLDLQRVFEWKTQQFSCHKVQATLEGRITHLRQNRDLDWAHRPEPQKWVVFWMQLTSTAKIHPEIPSHVSIHQLSVIILCDIHEKISQSNFWLIWISNLNPSPSFWAHWLPRHNHKAHVWGTS